MPDPSRLSTERRSPTAAYSSNRNTARFGCDAVVAVSGTYAAGMRCNAVVNFQLPILVLTAKCYVAITRLNDEN